MGMIVHGIPTDAFVPPGDGTLRAHMWDSACSTFICGEDRDVTSVTKLLGLAGVRLWEETGVLKPFPAQLCSGQQGCRVTHGCWWTHVL